ncbi:MAG TPA: cupredoxin domain-containing protein [Nitrososphaera sp.]|nr:cupredoxin domain-containing protein [Nitrososphaera sp.]
MKIVQDYKMRNNIIAIVAISFVAVGALWGIGNLISPSEPSETIQVEGILLVASDGAFNGTNPTIDAKVNVPKKLVVLNKDIVTHDLIIEDASGGILNVNTAPLRPEQHFNAAILGYHSGSYEYYCSYHPEMRGKITIT